MSSPRGSKGAVASESALCSRVGIQLIELGVSWQTHRTWRPSYVLTRETQGTAADAMVGTNLCVGVTGMYHSGIGGGGFMLVRSSEGKYEMIDYREVAPAAASRDMYRHDRDASTRGPLSVAVPGELRGLEYLHAKHGVRNYLLCRARPSSLVLSKSRHRYYPGAPSLGLPSILPEMASKASS
jgi:gamma-glutamyltranspeptidase / glutathione hydrolase